MKFTLFLQFSNLGLGFCWLFVSLMWTFRSATVKDACLRRCILFEADLWSQPCAYWTKAAFLLAPFTAWLFVPASRDHVAAVLF